MDNRDLEVRIDRLVQAHWRDLLDFPQHLVIVLNELRQFLFILLGVLVLHPLDVDIPGILQIFQRLLNIPGLDEQMAKLRILILLNIRKSLPIKCLDKQKTPQRIRIHLNLTKPRSNPRHIITIPPIINIPIEQIRIGKLLIQQNRYHIGIGIVRESCLDLRVECGADVLAVELAECVEDVD